MKHELEPCELTTICMIEKDDKILLQYRQKGEWDGWVMPGGHVEPGESFTEACRREVFEETGLLVNHLRMTSVKQFPQNGHRYIVFLYKTDSFTGTLKNSEEGENRWFSRSALPEDLVMDFDLMLRMFDDPSVVEMQYTLDEEGGYVPHFYTSD